MYTNLNYFLTKLPVNELNLLINEDENYLEESIKSADDLINSYLNTVTSTPLAEPPEVVKQLSYDIAVFYLHDRIQFNDIPDRIKDKYDAAIAFLKDIARGHASLPGIQKETTDMQVQHSVNKNEFDQHTF